jgi:hypothetical protein
MKRPFWLFRHEEVDEFRKALAKLTPDEAHAMIDEDVQPPHVKACMWGTYRLAVDKFKPGLKTWY